jgi:hypothetical protein
VACLVITASAAAQQLLDRIVARVNGAAITLSDVRAAIGLGIVNEAEGATEAAAAESMVDRQLVLAEVARFAPPEPPAADVDREAARMTAFAGPRLADLMTATGVDDARIREIARDTLRIRAYQDQRFGATVQLTEEEVAQYYRIHPEEFTRNGVLAPFAEAEPRARERASAERRANTVAQWVSDLRGRADIAIPRQP